jgi:hypothetical protein
MFSRYHAYAQQLKGQPEGAASMTLDEKIRYGMLALGGLGLVLTALGVHPNPLSDIKRGFGST